MHTITIPDNIKPNRIKNYMNMKESNLIEFISLLNSLGGYMTYGQHIRYIAQNNPNYSPSYCRKKSSLIINNLKANKVIDISQLNNNKYFYLKEFGVALSTNKDDNLIRINKYKGVKDGSFKIKLMKVEYYLNTKEIITLNTLDDHLVTLTEQIYKTCKSDSSLDYDMKLVKQLLLTKGDKDSIDILNSYEDDNILKLIWIDLKNIFFKLRLQGQTITKKPYYYKLYKNNGNITLHYVPEIIIFDIHNIEYYSKKLDILFQSFYNIKSNETEFTQKSYRENGTLGYKGYNKLAYTFRIIGDDRNSLDERQKYLDSHLKENINAMLLTNVKTEHVDISKYINHSSCNKKHNINIDSQITNLLLKELKGE